MKKLFLTSSLLMYYTILPLTAERIDHIGSDRMQLCDNKVSWWKSLLKDERDECKKMSCSK